MNEIKREADDHPTKAEAEEAAVIPPGAGDDRRTAVPWPPRPEPARCPPRFLRKKEAGSAAR